MDRPGTSKQKWQPPSKAAIVATNQEQLLQGSLGQRLWLTTNYYRVALKNRASIHVYTLQLSINGMTKKGKVICQELFWSAVSQFPNIFGPDYSNLVYDNALTLYSAIPLRNFNQELVEEGDSLGWDFNHMTTDDNRKYLVKIELKKVGQMVLEQQANVPLGHQQLQFLQSMYSQCVRCPMYGYPNNWFTQTTKIYRIPYNEEYTPIELGDCLVVLRALKCSFKLDCNGLPLFNSDLAHSVFAKVNLRLIDFYAMLYGTQLNDHDRQLLKNYTMNQEQMDQMDHALKGLMLKDKYSPRHYKYLKLVAPADVPLFEVPQYGRLTVQEYYKRRYDKNLKYPNMPLVKVHPAASDIYIPLEILAISERVQKICKRLRPNALATLVKETAYTPPNRFGMIQELVNDSLLCDNPFAQSFGVTIENKMIKLQGRKLPKPIMFGDNPKKGLVKVLDRTLVLAVVCINGATFLGLRSAIQNLVNFCGQEGITFERPPFAVFSYAFRPMGRQQVQERYDEVHFRENLKNIQNDANNAYPNAEPLFVFVVNDKNTDCIYDCIKTICQIDMGIMSQVIKIATLKRMQYKTEKPNGDSATLYNILLKINCKLQGINNSVLDCPGWSKFTKMNSPTLFLGVDAIHPSRDEEEMPSVAAVTANIDVQVSRFRGWFRGFHLEEKGNREVKELGTLFEEALDAFYQANQKQVPGHIVVLRDGISDSEISHLSQMELGQLGNACREFRGFYKLSNFQPTISYLVIQKKHGTRFWQTQNKQNGNVPSGTVVDSVITGALSRNSNNQLQNAQDFYLCSQEGRLGTSRPAHYTLVCSTWDLTADDWENCNFALCHLVGRSKAVVSTPAPVYYADLLCNRIRRYVHNYRRGKRSDFNTIVVQERLEKNMYWT